MINLSIQKCLPFNFHDTQSFLELDVMIMISLFWGNGWSL